jgi:hypothetical protein
MKDQSSLVQKYAEGKGRRRQKQVRAFSAKSEKSVLKRPCRNSANAAKNSPPDALTSG